MIGKRVGKYRIRTQLGSGATGSVYLAECESKRHALKVLNSDAESRESALRRFQREAAVGARINHPNVVRTLRADQAMIDGRMRHYLVMELVEGETLRDLMERAAPLSESYCRRVGRDVAGALTASHAAGLVHRDLKPENILIDEDGTAKVMDFGLAYMTAVDHDHDRFRGSVLYAAPEQFAGEVLDARTDWYALGLILYEMATGQHPSASSNIAQVMSMRLDQRPARARSVNPALSEFFDSVLDALLERDQTCRLGHLPSDSSPERRAPDIVNRPAMDWNEKHAARTDDREPAALLREHAHLLPSRGRALDIAAGGGRNAVFMAQAGLAVDAIDSSVVGLRKAADLAAERGVYVNTIVGDLERMPLAIERYDVVVNCYYLQRDLMDSIRAALKPGGLLIFETYTVDQCAIPGAKGPRRSEHLLERGELLAAFDDYEILYAGEVVGPSRAVASLVARKP